MLIRIITILLFCSVFPASLIAGGHAHFSGAVILIDNDNIANAELDEDKRTDLVTKLDLKYQNTLLSRPSVNINYAVGFSQSLHSDFDLLNQSTIQFALNLSYKTENAFSVPRYNVNLYVGQVDAKVDSRDAIFYRFALAYAKRLTDKISTRIGVEYYTQYADQDLNGQAVFDLDRQRFYANVDYKLGRHHILYFNYSLYDGDVISVGQESSKNMGFPRIHDAAFGPRSVSNLYAYRLDATAHVGSVGYHLALTRQSAADIVYRYANADAANYNNYQNHSVELAYLYRF